jgi:hypothetical protein
MKKETDNVAKNSLRARHKFAPSRLSLQIVLLTSATGCWNIYYSGIFLDGVRKTMNKTLLSRANIPAEIRNEYLSITSQARYRYHNPFGNIIHFIHSSTALQLSVGPWLLL